MYFDFAPDEPRPSTSKAVIEREVRKRELENALRNDGETEDTIRQLFQQIDDESFRTEEYTNQLGDFDAQSEEISKLKSLLEDSSEDYKNFIQTIDDLNGKISALEEALQDEKRRYLSVHADNHAKEMKLTELTIELQSVAATLTLAQQQRDRAEQKANNSAWENIQHVNTIAILQSQHQDKSGELLLLQTQSDLANYELEKLKKTDRDQKTESDRLMLQVHALIANCVPTKNLLLDQMLKQMNGGKVFAKISDSDAVAPYCGAINSWRYMIVPILDTFPVGQKWLGQLKLIDMVKKLWKNLRTENYCASHLQAKFLVPW